MTKTKFSDVSRNNSRNSVDDAIFKVLSSGPMKASDLEAKVIESEKCSPTTYSNRLRFLRESQQTISGHWEKDARVTLYALPQDRERLIMMIKGDDLQRQVIDDARYLRNYMMREAEYKSDGKYMSTNVNIKFDYFLDEIYRLRKTNPRVPEFICAEVDKPEDCRDDAVIIRAAYRYVLTILDFFKAL